MNHDRSRPLRSHEIRRANERIILRLLHDHGTAAQSDIVERTGLQASTVFRIFTSLEQHGLIRKAESAEPTIDRVGRRPTYYRLEPRARVAVGAEIAGTGITVAVAGFDGSVLHHEAVLTGPDYAADLVVTLLAKTIGRALKVSGVDRESLAGIAVGAPGVIDIEHGSVLEYGRFAGMGGLPIGPRLQQEFDVPTFVHNNTAIIAHAEYRYGRAQGVRSLTAFLLRTGVGGAYITDGRIAESQGRSVFEIGHLYPDLSSLDTDVAGRGTVLEDYLGEQALLEHVATSTPDIDSWDRLIAALEADDAAAAAALKPRADLLAAAARNIALLLSPEALLIVTRFSALSEFFARSVKRRFASVSDPIRLGVRRIIPVAYDSLITGRGAADLVFDRYFTGAGKLG